MSQEGGRSKEKRGGKGKVVMRGEGKGKMGRKGEREEKAVQNRGNRYKVQNHQL